MKVTLFGVKYEFESISQIQRLYDELDTAPETRDIPEETKKEIRRVLLANITLLKKETCEAK